MGRMGSVRFSAWTWLFSSTHNTMARSGGFRYRPTISHLLHELGIFGEFELLHSMRLQSECMPDPHDGVLRQTRLGSHQPSAPVRAVLWHRFQRLGYDLFNLLIRDLPRRAYPRLIRQAIQSELPKSFPPLANGRTSNMQFSGDFRVAHPLPTGKHDASTHRHCLS